MTKTTRKYRTAASIVEDIRMRLVETQRALARYESQVMYEKAQITVLQAILDDAKEKGGPEDA